MALTPQNENAFFREVDEELRRAQLKGFWQRYGRWLIGLVALGLIAFAGILWWQHDHRQRAGADGENLSGVLSDLSESKKKAAEPKLDALLASSREGYRSAARFIRAGIAAEENDTPAMIAQFKLIADDPDAPRAMRDLAIIRRTLVEYDRLTPAEIVQRLKPLAVAGGPWFGTSGEMLAIAYLDMKKPELAAPLFALLARDEQVPETIRARATRIAGLVGGNAAAAPPAPKG